MHEYRDSAAPSKARRALTAILASMSVGVAVLCAACSEPRLVILTFELPSAPALSAASASVTYAWSFTPATASSLAETDGLPVAARLYKTISAYPGTAGTTRILAAESRFALKGASGTASCVFTLASALSSGTYYVEVSFADDLGPQVTRSAQANL